MSKIEILRHKQLKERVPFSRAEIDRRVRAGTFPPPIRLGPAAIGWIASEVDEWLMARPRLGDVPVDAWRQRLTDPVVPRRRGRPSKVAAE